MTTDTWERRPLFKTERMARAFLKRLFSYRGQGKFALHEFVIMPDHVHLLLTPHGIALERAMQFIKGGFSHDVSTEFGSNIEVWQRGFADHRVRDAQDYAVHVSYVHQNPVRRGLVAQAEAYPYASAHGGFELDPAPNLSG